MATYGKMTSGADFVYCLELDNFLKRPEANGKFFNSPSVAVTDNNGRIGILCLQIYPKGDSRITTHVSLFIINKTKVDLEFIYRLSIRDSNDHFVNQFQSENCILKYGSGWGNTNFIDIDYLKNNQASLLPGGTLTICLEVIKPRPRSAISCLSEDLQICMDDPQFSDCEIVTNDVTIKCHRFMLASRSCVFKAMLQDGFKEGQTGIIKIDDKDPEVIKDIVKFIYCGKLDKLGENAAELFRAADMYQIDNLKDACGNYMQKNMNTDNVLDIITLADAHSDDNLKNAAIDFIVRNVKMLMEDKKWESLPQELVMQILKNVVNQRVI